MDTHRESDSESAPHLQRAPALYREFFEHAPHGFFVAETDAFGHIEFVLINRHAEPLLNAQMATGLGDYAAELSAAIALLAAGPPGERLRIEREDLLSLQDDMCHVKTLLTLLYEDGGRLERVTGIIDDISPQKSREYMLALREAEFRQVAERLGTGLVRFDQSCRRIYVNPYVAEAYGRPLVELLGTRPSEFPGGENGAHYEAQIREVFCTGQYAEYSQQLTINDTGRWCRLMLFPEWLPTGEVGSVLAVGQDYEDRRSKLRLLQYGAQEFEPFAERSSNVILCFNRGGECTYLNETAAHLFREIGQIPPFAPLDEGRMAHPLEATVQSAIHQVLESQAPLENELVWSMANNRHYHYRIRYLPKRSLQGDIVSVLVIARSIAPVSTAVQDPRADCVMANREMVREAERNRIALELHDELGQLLTALRFRLALLRPQFGTGEPTAARSLQEAQDIVERATREVRRITSSAGPVQLDIGLHTALTELVDDFSAHTGIEFALTITAEPELDEAATRLIFRIVQESLTNIARHSGARHATVSLTREGSNYCLKITDNGRGFEMSAPQRRSLGLAGIRERVLLLKGELSIQSTPGRGTAIHIAIPG